jgi:hypothetical protein
MGKLINGINGPIKGKVGKVSGSSKNGNPYVKGPTKPRTKKISTKEKQNRDQFSMSQYWLQPIKEFVREGFRGFTLRPHAQGFAAAKSYLSKNALEGKKPDLTINPAKVLVSYGDLPSAENMKAEKHDDMHIKFTWDNTFNEELKFKDQAMLLAYDIDNKKAFMSIFGQFRNTGEEILKISYYKKSKYKPNGGTFHCYLGFVAADRSRRANSVYLGAITFEVK